MARPTARPDLSESEAEIGAAVEGALAMDFDATCRLIGLEVDPATAEACRFLETKGQRFCVDFGTETAVGLAGSLLIERNPPLPIAKSFHMLGAGLRYLTDEDMEWFREMEKAFVRNVADST